MSTTQGNSVSPAVARHRAKVQEKLRANKTTRFSDPLLKRFFGDDGKVVVGINDTQSSMATMIRPPKPLPSVQSRGQIDREPMCAADVETSSVASGASYMSAGFFTAASRALSRHSRGDEYQKENQEPGSVAKNQQRVACAQNEERDSNKAAANETLPTRTTFVAPSMKSGSFAGDVSEAGTEMPSRYSIDNDDSFTVRTGATTRIGRKKVTHYKGDIVEAARCGDVKAVHKLIKQAMIAAASAGHDSVVERLLLDQGLRPPWDAVHAAAAKGHHDVMESYLMDPRINFKSSSCKALRVAAANSQLVVLKQLLEDRRVNPAAKENKAIRIAAELGHLAVVDRLMDDKRVNPSVKDNQALRYASKNGHLAVVELLLKDPRCDPGARNSSCLQLAVSNGHIAVVDRLLRDHRCDPACDNNICLDIAARIGYANIVDKLLSTRKVNPAIDDNKAFHIAVENGHHEVVQRLLRDRRCDPSSRGNLAIVVASERGYASVVECLLKDHRVDPSIQGNKALRSAAERYHSEVVQLLIKDTRVDSQCLSNFALAWTSPVETKPRVTRENSRALFQPKKMLRRRLQKSSSVMGASQMNKSSSSVTGASQKSADNQNKLMARSVSSTP